VTTAVTTAGTTAPSRAPGVYPQDVFPPPPRGLLTGVPAFLGLADVAADAQLRPRRVALWPEFVAAYGPATPGYLATAVRGFFENGGQLCYVVPLGATPASLPVLQDGLAAVAGLDDIDLVCAPDLIGTDLWPPDTPVTEVAAQQRAVLDHCAGRGDRFAILDGVPSAVPTGAVVAQHDALVGPAGTYGAVYSPWLWVPGTDGTPQYVPPCGHVAGVVARTDLQAGVHKAPANEVVEGVLDLQVVLTAQDVGQLHAGGVNGLWAVPGRGIRVWGAQTLAADPTWRDVTARRTELTVRRWLQRFMERLVHEPNDVRLRVRIMRELTAYLDGLFQRGALQGTTAADAFFVKCDDETNPPEVVDAGLVVTQIGLALTAPAEFVDVRIIHGASGVTVTP
jgi:uncharacterized protein